MGINRSIYYGFDGQRDAIPRIPRSARRRENNSSEEESTKFSAFDLLATLAGTLLQEGKSFSTSSNAVTVNNKHIFDEKSEKEDAQIDTQQQIVPNLCDVNVVTSDSSSKKGKHMYKKIKFVHGKSAVSECVSTITNLGTDDRTRGSTKSSANLSEGTGLRSVVGGSLDFGESLDHSIENAIEIKLCSNHEEDRDLTPMADTSDSFSKQLNLDMCQHNIGPHSPFSRHREDFCAGNKGEDIEDSPRNRQFALKLKPFKHSTHVVGRRVKRLFKSKSWKLLTRFKKHEAGNALHSHVGIGPLRVKMKARKTRKRYHEDMVSDDKKLVDLTAEDGSSHESFVFFPENQLKRDSCSGGGDMASGHQASLLSDTSHVKLKIKSIKVPEFSIELPNTATVGHLKRVVMAAVLGREYHIGVILDGEEIRDNDRRLLEAGISHKDHLAGLSFSLEPCGSQLVGPPPPPADGPPTLRQCCDPRHFPRFLPTAVSGVGVSEVPAEESPTHTFGNYSGSNTRISSPTEAPTRSSVSDSRAMITAPSLKAEALSLVPINQHGRRSDRRTRRPFSVYEVEALVQAVEEIGTGRWRDVKLSAFENATHRTYVDLKDKWKTLVHTASISPHQRRGEPVPQQLLDRVLRAHANWSAQQHGLRPDAMVGLGFAYHQDSAE